MGKQDTSGDIVHVLPGIQEISRRKRNAHAPMGRVQARLPISLPCNNHEDCVGQILARGGTWNGAHAALFRASKEVIEATTKKLVQVM